MESGSSGGASAAKSQADGPDLELLYLECLKKAGPPVGSRWRDFDPADKTPCRPSLRLAPELVAEIRAAVGEPVKRLARRLGVHPATVRKYRMVS